MNLKNLFNNPNRPALSREQRRARRIRRIVGWFWGVFLGIGFLITLLMLLIYNGVVGYMPPIEELEDPHDKLASVVFAADGTELGRYFKGSGNRINNDYDNISPHVIDALIATEDVRFDEHSGVDFRALGRSMFKTLLLNDRSSGGGSTITQQLAKQLYSEPTGNFFKRMLQKPIEWMIAVKLERFYTKKEILAMYLNRFDFLHNAVGIKSAANVYFGKEPENLNIQEAATLVGMLKNPSVYNPKSNHERSLQRRNTVIDQMVKAEMLSDHEADSIKALPLELNFHRVDYHQGGAPYLREEIRRLMTAKRPTRPVRGNYSNESAWLIALGNYQTDSTEWENNSLYGWIEKNPKPNGEKYNLYTDGLRIYTTIDMKMQQYAEEAVAEHLGGSLQPAFFKEKSGASGPYNTPGVSKADAQRYIDNAIRHTERWRVAKANGMSEDDIYKTFEEEVEMDLFAYNYNSETKKYEPGSKRVSISPKDSLLYMKTILRTGLVSMDPLTGYVKAYVGGPSFEWFQYDMAGRGKRQIGSTTKPFLYTLAMEDKENYSPSTRILNTQPTYGNWSPRNSSRARIGEMVDLKWALTTSNNWISAKLLADLLPANFVNKLRMFGISGYMEPSMPLALGSNEASVKEMVSAYSTFANEGLRANPVYVTRIEDNKGNVIYNGSPHQEEVTDKETAYTMVTMLESVIENGTGRALRGGPYNIKAKMGGKTGTTNANADAWFIGFTPELVTGIWIGGEERTIRFNTMAFGQGAKAALPIYGLFMKKVYADKDLPYSQDADFIKPEGYKPRGYSSGAVAPKEETPAVETVQGMY